MSKIKEFFTKSKKNRMIAIAILLAVLIISPKFFSGMQLRVLTTILIYCILAVGNMVITGYTGMLNMGQGSLLWCRRVHISHFINQTWPAFSCVLPAGRLFYRDMWHVDCNSVPACPHRFSQLDYNSIRKYSKCDSFKLDISNTRTNGNPSHSESFNLWIYIFNIASILLSDVVLYNFLLCIGEKYPQLKNWKIIYGNT